MTAKRKIGIDADQEVGREKVTNDQKQVKAAWMGSKMTFVFPKSLAMDFKEECHSRKLTHHGILRDLALIWVIANKPGVIGEDYRKKIQDEVTHQKAAAVAHDKAQKAKLTAHEKRKKFFDDQKANPPITKQDKSLHNDNPYEEGDWQIKA